MPMDVQQWHGTTRCQADRAANHRYVLFYAIQTARLSPDEGDNIKSSRGPGRHNSTLAPLRVFECGFEEKKKVLGLALLKRDGPTQFFLTS